MLMTSIKGVHILHHINRFDVAYCPYALRSELNQALRMGHTELLVITI